MNLPINILLLIVLFLFFIGSIFFLALRRLRKGEEKRHALLKGNQQSEAPVATNSPLDDPQVEEHETATESIEGRFSIIRRILIAVFALILMIGLSLPFLGTLPTAVISLLVAAASVFLGIAAKPFLENFVAGIVLTFARPFRVGDTVHIDKNYYGIVEDITMTYTIIKVWDWQRYVVPNSLMMSKDFINLTLKDNYIWAYVEFWVAHDADIDQVRDIAITATKNSKAFASHESPDFWVMKMEERAIQCWVAGWTNSPADAWQLKSDVREELIRQFQKNNIKTHHYSVEPSKSLLEPASA